MYLEYPSSQNPDIKLFADFCVPSEPRPILLSMHGWHGQVKEEHADNVAPPSDPDWFLIRPEMRGRGDSTGKPDCNGWEIQDTVDAVEFAKCKFAEHILNPEQIRLQGGSGGGGNVFALVGKFPDYFSLAASQCGVSDYALWFRNDEVGEFRDEMQDEGWIGGTPEKHPEAYASRSGLTTVSNLLTPMLIFHGENDQCCPAEHSRSYVREAENAGRGHLVTYHELKGVGANRHWENITDKQAMFMKKTVRGFLKQDVRTISIPRHGRFIVAGYLKTKLFDIILESVDHIGVLEYDIERDTYDLAAPTARRAILRRKMDDGTWKEERLRPNAVR